MGCVMWVLCDSKGVVVSVDAERDEEDFECAGKGVVSKLSDGCGGRVHLH